MCDRWEEIVSSGPSVINICIWSSRATLDIVGEGMSHVCKGKRDVTLSHLLPQLRSTINLIPSLMTQTNSRECIIIFCASTLTPPVCLFEQRYPRVSAFGVPNSVSVLVQQLVAYLPAKFFALLDRLPARSLKTLREVAKEGFITGHMLLRKRYDNAEVAKGRDVLSLLGEHGPVKRNCAAQLKFLFAVKANESESSSYKLSDEELIAEIRCVTICILISTMTD